MTFRQSGWLSVVRQRWQRRRFITNSAIYVLGSLLQNALAFLLIPVYTRYLTPEDFGISGVALAIGGVLTSLLGWGMYGSLTRYYYEHYGTPDRLKSFVATNFSFIVLVGGAITFLLTFIGESLWLRFTEGQVPFAPYIQLVLWESYAAAVFQIPTTLYRTEQKALAFIFAQFGKFILNLVAIILFVVIFGWGVYGLLLGRLVSTGFLTFVLLLPFLRQWFTWRLRWSDLRDSLQYSLPLIPHIVLSWALNSADRLLLESRVSLTQLGLYNLGYRVGMVMSVIVFGINQAWMPYYMKLMKESERNDERIRQTVELYVALVGGVCLGGVLFSRELLQVIATPEYFAAARFIPLVLFAYLFNGYYYFASAPLFFHNQTSRIPLMTILSAGLNIALNIWWIPKIGALASAWATFLAFVMITMVAYFLSRSWQKIAYPWGRLFVSNGLIFGAVVWMTYEDAVGWIGLTSRFICLCSYVALVFVWFIRPNQHLWLESSVSALSSNRSS